MLVLSPERANVALTAVVSAATLAALALAGTVLAYWTWTWLAPRPEAGTLPVDPGADAAQPRELFGTAQRERTTSAPAGISVKLLGVIAATRGRRGYAVLQLEGRILAVAEGNEAAPGIRVAEVHPDHVVLSRGGVRESLAWPQKSAAPQSAAPRIDK